MGAAGLDFQKWLYDFIRTFHVEMLGIEAPMLGGARRRESQDAGRGIVMNAATARLLIGLAFDAEVVAYSCGIPCYEDNVQTIRKWLLGEGRPKNPKARVIQYFQSLGWTIKSHDAADATALWAFLKAHRDKSFRVETTSPLFALAQKAS